MNEEKNVIYCSRCGAEMNDNSRYCMKCGNLNYNHDANKEMRPFISIEEKGTYQVGSGKFAVQNNDMAVQTSIGNSTGSKKICFFITLLAYVVSLIFCFFNNSTFVFSVFAIIISILFLYIYAIELIFMKCNKLWWSALIPVYNGMVLSDIVFHKSWIGVLLFVPIVGQIIFLLLLYHLGKSFRYNGILTALLSFVYLLFIGYGNRFYEGHAFTSSLDDTTFLEREYKYKKIFLTVVSIFLFVSFAIVVFFHFDEIKKKISSFPSYYYVYAAKRIVSKTEKAIVKGNFECEKDAFSNTGIYYFSYPDLGNYVYLPLYYSREVISGYVKVEYNNGTYQYFVSVGDLEKGIPETSIDSITTDSVIDMDFHSIDTSFNGSCQIR